MGRTPLMGTGSVREKNGVVRIVEEILSSALNTYNLSVYRTNHDEMPTTVWKCRLAIQKKVKVI